jgi:4-amino-4-deoxy-L-arabinose transferase-like glycosyltransferase
VIGAFARWRAPAVGFCLAWAVPAWVLFALVPTKLPHYVLPAYPALALLAGAALVQAWSRRPGRLTLWALRLHLAVWGLLGLGLAGALAVLPTLYSQHWAPLDLWWSLPVALAALAGTLVAVHAAWTGRMARAAGACLALSLVCLPWVGEVYGPRLDKLWVAREVAERLPPPEARPPLAAAGYHEPSLVFLNGTDTRLTNAEAVAEHLAATPGAYGLLTDRHWARFRAAAQARDLTYSQVTRFPGFNYSNGDPVELHLVRAAPAADPAGPDATQQD